MPDTGGFAGSAGTVGEALRCAPDTAPATASVPPADTLPVRAEAPVTASELAVTAVASRGTGGEGVAVVVRGALNGISAICRIIHAIMRPMDQQDFDKTAEALLNLVLPEAMVRIQADAELSLEGESTGDSPLSVNFGTSNDVLVDTIYAVTPSAATAVTLTIGDSAPLSIPAGLVTLTDLRKRVRSSIYGVSLAWAGGSVGTLIAAGRTVTTKGKP